VSNTDGAAFDPRRLKDRQRPSNVVASVISPKNKMKANGSTEIKVFGVGGAGNNALNRMVSEGISGVELIAVNSDSQDLAQCLAASKLSIGRNATGNLGAGGDPSMGERAASESIDEIRSSIEGADMVFVTAGMGGGTGTGAAPVVAKTAMEMGVLTVGIVSKPFVFEGSHRNQAALDGLDKMSKNVDSLVVIENNLLMNAVHRDTSIEQAFYQADKMLLNGVRGITDLITTVGIVNVDFADVRSVMKLAGTAVMSLGSGRGDNRADEALQAAMDSPLLACPISNADGVLINITGGEDLGIHEINHVVTGIQKIANIDAQIVFGAVIDPRLSDTMTVTVIATGLDRSSINRRQNNYESEISLDRFNKVREIVINTNKSEDKDAVTTNQTDDLIDNSNPIATESPIESPDPEPSSTRYDDTAPKSQNTDFEVQQSFDLSDSEIPAFIRRRQDR
tara:strand:+ start:4155 stop:5510 length:1356 start_codon:yes stop_codon:yes gene_type:complete